MFVYELSGCGFESRCSHLIYWITYNTSRCKKRDNKARTFAPPDNTTESAKIIDFLESADKDEEELKLIYKLSSGKRKIPKDFDIDKLLGDVKKRDNKARAFAPPDNRTESTKIIDLLESPDKNEEDLKSIHKLSSNKRKIPKDFDIDKLLGDVKKRDNKARTFAPPDNRTESTKIIDYLESADKDEEELKLIHKLSSDKRKIPKDFHIDKLL